MEPAHQFYDDSAYTRPRLPVGIFPKHYDVSLKINFHDLTFEGHVFIDFESKNYFRKDIVIHARDLKIIEGYCDCDTFWFERVIYSKTTETVTLKFGTETDGSDFGYVKSEQIGQIYLRFSGRLNDQMKGFYRTALKIDDNLVYAASTQFEPTSARRCFPCFDEPALKATFSVTLNIEKNFTIGDKKYERIALSNTEIERVSTNWFYGTEHTRFEFKKTQKMSTYLLAFVVGVFEKIESVGEKRNICIYSPPGKSEQGRYGLEVACKSLKFYEEYFGLNYEGADYNKIDLIAIPDYSMGAMENWGLVTFRESALLVDPNNTSTNRLQYVAVTVAHELAHMWFGNLVTMEWWTDLWLKEGFATFMSYLCVDHIFPEYGIWLKFVTDCYERGISLDALHNSHPIEVPVKWSHEIREIFDAISYLKGSSIIKPLHAYIGEESFKKGMNLYLNHFAYKNAKTKDLWTSLRMASNKPIEKIMSTWTKQKGFPWLSVECSKEGDKTKLVLTQNKFTADGKILDEEADSRWSIPIMAVCGSDPSKSINLGLLEEKTGEFFIVNPNDDWVKLNPGSVGFYRVAYPEEMAKKLLPAITNQVLPSLDRLNLQSDFFALCQAGKVKTADYLDLLKAYKEETVFPVWKSIDFGVGTLNSLLLSTDCKDKFHIFGRDLYSRILRKLTWLPTEGENLDDGMLRAIVLNRLVDFEDPTVIEEAKSKFKAHLDKTYTIPADIRGVVYKAISIYGDDEAFDHLFTLFYGTDVSEEKNRIGSALGCAKDLSRQKRMIELAFSEDVRSQDLCFFLTPLGRTSPDAAWKSLTDKKHILRERFGDGNLLEHIVRSATENFVTEVKAQEIEQFFQDNKFPGVERAIQQSIETIRISSSWLAREGDAIRAYLS